MLWPISICACIVFLIAPVLYSRFFSRNDVPFIRGPPSASWLYGNMFDLLVRIPYGEIEEKWQRSYGRVYRVKACFGVDRLMITDSAALRYIASNSSLFIRPRPFQMLMKLGFGNGSLISTEGNNHHRLREIMNPAFSAKNVRSLLPTLTKVTGDLVDRLLSQCENHDSSCVVDIYRHLHDASLQAVGEAIMGYNFAADEEFKKCYENLVISSAKKTKSAILMDSIIPYLPEWTIQLVTYYPPEDLKQILKQRLLTKKIADPMVKNKLKMQQAGLLAEKDLFSTIVEINSNATEAMSHDELRDQFGLLNAAGEDTTANTLSWALYQLAKDTEMQEMLRKEVTQAQQIQAGYVDYEKLPYLNSFIKEVLRFYGIAANSARVADQATVIPLSTPITTTTGRMLTEIAVKKGQYIVIPIHSYHRLTELWGTDADVFRPTRWLDGKSQLGDRAAIGPFSNLLSFWGGAYTCIGWRFAILETQIILCELIKKFSFSLDADAPPIYPTIAFTLAPSDGKGNFQMKLRVSAL